jgi:hypothetical protein
VSFESVVALTRSDPEDSGLSVYGSIMALPQLPSAPSEGFSECEAIVRIFNYLQRA